MAPNTNYLLSKIAPQIPSVGFSFHPGEDDLSLGLSLDGFAGMKNLDPFLGVGASFNLLVEGKDVEAYLLKLGYGYHELIAGHSLNLDFGFFFHKNVGLSVGFNQLFRKEGMSRILMGAIASFPAVDPGNNEYPFRVMLELQPGVGIYQQSGYVDPDNSEYKAAFVWQGMVSVVYLWGNKKKKKVEPPKEEKIDEPVTLPLTNSDSTPNPYPGLGWNQPFVGTPELGNTFPNTPYLGEDESFLDVEGSTVETESKIPELVGSTYPWYKKHFHRFYNIDMIECEYLDSLQDISVFQCYYPNKSSWESEVGAKWLTLIDLDYNDNGYATIANYTPSKLTKSLKSMVRNETGQKKSLLDWIESEGGRCGLIMLPTADGPAIIHECFSSEWNSSDQYAFHAIFVNWLGDDAYYYVKGEEKNKPVAKKKYMPATPTIDMDQLRRWKKEQGERDSRWRYNLEKTLQDYRDLRGPKWDRENR